MSLTSLPSIVSSPTGPVKKCVIWLHGLGADGNDFAPIVNELGIQNELGIRFIFPHAAAIPVSINGGMSMPAWYDISEMDLMKRADSKGIASSTAIITAMINEQIKSGLKASDIVIAGFSQGGVIAINTGICFQQKLAGIMALSTYVPMQDSLPNAAQSGHADIPIFYAHGQYDPIIPIEQAQTSKQFLEHAGYSIDWHSYAMEHSVSAAEIADIKHWLLRVLA